MKRTWAAALALGVLTVANILLVSTAVAAPMSVKVRPDSGLIGGTNVTISGRGLVKSFHGTPQTWFVTECTAAVKGHLDPSTDTSHCDITNAIPVKVGRNGTFTVHYRVISGIVGDGYCGTVGHLACVIGVGTAQGLGTVVRISFTAPGSPGTATGRRTPSALAGTRLTRRAATPGG